MPGYEYGDEDTERYWTLAFDGGPDQREATGLLARGVGDSYDGFWTDDRDMGDSYDGFWTDDRELVALLSSKLADAAP